jgi:spore coat protein CotH
MRFSLAMRWALTIWLCAFGSSALAAGPGNVDIFEPDHILEIQITIAPDSWDKLRAQERDVKTAFGKERLEHTIPKPYTWFKADAIVDGVKLDSVGMRKRGFLGSNDHDRPAMNIELDRFVEGQRFAGHTALKLHNNKQDPGAVRQALSYQVFRAAGVAAPRCNFAHVTVNGKDLGIYSNIEPVNPAFLNRQFGNDGGNLYEATLSDFRPGWVKTFEKKNHKSDAGREDLDAVVQALEKDDDHLLDALGRVLDIDAFINFWVVESLIGHWDGFAGDQNNCFVYHDKKTDKLRFIAWGADATFSSQQFFVPYDPPASVMAVSILPRRLYNHPITRDKYRKRMQEVLDTIWDEKKLLADMDRMVKLIRGRQTEPAIAAVTSQQQMRQFIRDRRGAIEAELHRPAAPWNYPLRRAVYFQDVGKITVKFSTAHVSSFISVPPKWAKARVELDFYGRHYASDFTDVKAMPAPGESGKVFIMFSGSFAGVEAPIYIFVRTNAATFKAGGEQKLDGKETMVGVAAIQPRELDFRLLGSGEVGTIRFTEAGTTAGAKVEGTLQSNVMALPWEDFDLTKLKKAAP